MDAVAGKKSSFVSSSNAEMVWAMEPCDDLSDGKECIDQPSTGLRDIGFSAFCYMSFTPL
jgi:hypothetical protein